MTFAKRLASAAVFAAVLSTPALAQTVSQQAAQAPTVAAPTAGHHQPVTPEQRAARFDRADANHDGKLTKAEFTASMKGGRAARADKMWSHLNPTGKDSITKADYLAAPMGHGKGAAKPS